MMDLRLFSGTKLRTNLDTIQQMVLEWLALHEDELLKMWRSQTIGKLPPLL